MANIVNARDTLLQGSASRYVASVVPSLQVDYSNVGGTKPPSNADNTSTAVHNMLYLGSGGIEMYGGSIKGGQTGYNLGSGFFMGFDGGLPAFSFGNSAGHHIRWKAGVLTIVGNIDFSNVQNGPPANADNTTSALNANVTTSGQITLTTQGHIKAGQWWYDQGPPGFFLGWDTTHYKFSLGDPSYADGPRLRWNGFQLELLGNTDINVTGTARFGGWNDWANGSTAVLANDTLNAQVGVGAYGRADGWAFYGVGAGAGNGIFCVARSSGFGGSFESYTGIAVRAYQQNFGRGLEVGGSASINTLQLAINWNAEYWNGVKISGAPTTGAGTATYNGSNKPGGSSTNQWLPLYDSSTGNTYYLPIWL